MKLSDTDFLNIQDISLPVTEAKNVAMSNDGLDNRTKNVLSNNVSSFDSNFKSSLNVVHKNNIQNFSTFANQILAFSKLPDNFDEVLDIKYDLETAAVDAIDKVLVGYHTTKAKINSYIVKYDIRPLSSPLLEGNYYHGDKGYYLLTPVISHHIYAILCSLENMGHLGSFF